MSSRDPLASHASSRRPSSRGRVLRGAAWALVAGLLLAVAVPAPAEARSAARKFGRGLAAMTCGFLEFPGNIYEETRRRGPIGVPIGMALGAGKIVARELIGVYEFLTAPFPLPAGFEPILRPEFPWGYFESPPPGRP